MAYYSQKADTRINFDGSTVVLGCILEQEHGDNSRPVAYVSKTSNVVKQCYLQIEDELLGFVINLTCLFYKH